MASFDGLSSDVRTALENSPTRRLKYSLYSVHQRQGGNVCIASHTGSGKTLAYLLPIIDALKREEIEADGDRLAKSRRPRALIVSPAIGTDIRVTKSLCYESVLEVDFGWEAVRVAKAELGSTGRCCRWNARETRETLRGKVCLGV